MSLFVIIIICLTEVSAILYKTYVFNTTEDFDKYVTNSKDINISGYKIFLNSNITRENRYLWVANSQEGSVSKIDTRTDKEVARYWTGNHSGLTAAQGGEYPSRTAVDIQENVWVGNRLGDRTVVKIMSNISDCPDNGDGYINTSYDTNSNSVIDSNEILPWGKDDCVILSVSFLDYLKGDLLSTGYVGPRAVAIDLQGYVWVGLYQDYQYIKIDSKTGDIIANVSVTNPPYGAVIDENGILWGSSSSNQLTRIDTNTNKVSSFNLIANTYGIAVDKSGRIWMGQWAPASNASNLLEVNASNPNQQILHALGPPSTLGITGITVDSNGHIWGTSHVTGVVYEYIPETDSLGCNVSIGPNPHGVAEGYGRYIWAICIGCNYVSKIDPNTCSVIVNVPTGPSPYTYSDATGSLLSQFIKRGILEMELPVPWAGALIDIGWNETNMLGLGGNISFEIKKGGSSFITTEKGVFSIQNINSLPKIKITITITRNTDYLGTSPNLENLIIMTGCSKISDNETNCANKLDEDCDDLIDYQDPECINKEEECLALGEINSCNNWTQHIQYLCGWECENGNCPPNPNINIGNCSACSNIFDGCSGYNNNITCDKDPCYKKEIDCTLIECNSSLPYSCFWDSDNICRFQGYMGVNNCVYKAEILWGCDEDIGVAILNYTGFPPENCPSKTIKYLCSRGIKLPFFNIIGIFITFVLIILFYYFDFKKLSQNKKHFN